MVVVVMDSSQVGTSRVDKEDVLDVVMKGCMNDPFQNL